MACLDRSYSPLPRPTHRRRGALRTTSWDPATTAEDARAKLGKGYRVMILGYDVYAINTYVGGLLKAIRG